MLQARNLSYCLSQLSLHHACLQRLHNLFHCYQRYLSDQVVYANFLAAAQRCSRFAKADTKQLLQEYIAKLQQQHQKLVEEKQLTEGGGLAAAGDSDGISLDSLIAGMSGLALDGDDDPRSPVELEGLAKQAGAAGRGRGGKRAAATTSAKGLAPRGKGRATARKTAAAAKPKALPRRNRKVSASSSEDENTDKGEGSDSDAPRKSSSRPQRTRRAPARKQVESSSEGEDTEGWDSDDDAQLQELAGDSDEETD